MTSWMWKGGGPAKGGSLTLSFGDLLGDADQVTEPEVTDPS